MRRDQPSICGKYASAERLVARMRSRQLPPLRRPVATRLELAPQGLEENAQEFRIGVEPLTCKRSLAELQESHDPESAHAVIVAANRDRVLLQDAALVDPLAEQLVTRDAWHHSGEEVLVVPARLAQ